MGSVGVVGRNHEGAADGAQQVLLVAAERHVDACEQVGEQRRCGALFGAAAGLFVVEDGCHERGSGVVGGAVDERGDGGVGHAEIVDAPRGDEFVVEAERAGGRGVVEREVEIEDVGRVDI